MRRRPDRWQLRFKPFAKYRIPATAYSAIASVFPAPRDVVTIMSLPPRSPTPCGPWGAEVWRRRLGESVSTLHQFDAHAVGRCDIA